MRKEIKYYIVLDANIIIKDYWLEGQGFSYLLLHKFLNHYPVISEVVFQEIRNNLKNNVQELISKTTTAGKRSTRNLTRLMSLFNYKVFSHKLSWNVDELLNRWEIYIKETLTKFNGLLLPIPKIDINDIVKRSIKRQKPFSNGDRGFRDTLIWLSTLELIGPNSFVSYITNNTKDFFYKKSKDPHPELLAEANKKLKTDQNMLFFRSVDEFIIHFESKNRKSSSMALKRSLISEGLSNFSLWYWLKNNLVEILSEERYDGLNWAGVPYAAEEIEVTDIETLTNLDVSSVDYLYDEIYRLYCDFAFIGKFACEIILTKIETIFNPNQILWKEYSKSFWDKVGFRSSATFLASIDFDINKQSVVNCLIIPLQHWSNYEEEVENLEKLRNQLD